MVVDTSVVAAIIFNEPDQRQFEDALEAAPRLLMSAVTRVEATFVVEARKRDAGRRGLERFFQMTGIEIVGVTAEHAELAMQAFRRFGKRRDPAALNIGDCFSYALAKVSNDTLLFKGNDFSKTDIKSALRI